MIPEEVKNYVRSSGMPELVELGKVVSRRMKNLTVATTSCFEEGDIVEFAARRGNTLRGTITKVNRMTVYLLDQTGVRWRVSSTLLKKVG